jgi:pyruvate formate lyase activating enzyme
MGVCGVCGRESPLVAAFPGVCLACLRTRPEEALVLARNAQAETRREFGLPTAPPRQAEGSAAPCAPMSASLGRASAAIVACARLSAGGWCIWRGRPGVACCIGIAIPCPPTASPTGSVPATRPMAITTWPSSTPVVPLTACSASCRGAAPLRPYFRQVSPVQGKGLSAQELADVANSRTFCVCYFGGDPASQMPHALAASRLLAARGVRICWETNGSMHPRLLDQAVELSLISGGCIKFDLKAYDEAIHRALTGTSNCRTLDNFARAAQRSRERPDPPLVVASTLLVPGYVDAQEVGAIARFIAGLNPDIPYALLAFAPNFYMSDLPCTSLRHAAEAEAAARAAGLRRVHVGNRHLLSRDY